MPNPLLGLMAMACFSFQPSPTRAQECGIGLTSASGAPGTTVPIHLFLTNEMPMVAFEASLYFDDKLTLDENAISREEAPDCIKNAAFFETPMDAANRCLGIGLVVDFSVEDVKLPPGTRQNVLILPVTISADAVCGEVLRIRLQDGCGDPPKENYMTLRDASGVLERCAPSAENIEDARIIVDFPPSAAPDTARTMEGQDVKILVLENDSDACEDALTVRDASKPSSGSVTNDEISVTYTPDPDFYGTDTFTYTASDQNGNTSTATVTVTIDRIHERFLRGDPNGDGETDLSDAIFLLLYLFDGKEISCKESGDANDDGLLDISDAIFTLDCLFVGGERFSDPYPDCGLDLTADPLGCESFPQCNP